VRGKLFVFVESVFLGLGMLALTPSGNPTTAGPPRHSSPAQSSVSAAPSIIPSASKAVGPQKALRVWECVASWYGEDFDGRPTATGEIYDMYAATAAHPALPLGSIVRVVNTRNHRSQVVRINDRGPYVEGRELDVSYEVARKLDFDQTGVAKVRLELLEVPSVSAPVR
jgi:rare lipoprotein A